MIAAFDVHMVDALRLLWEIVASTEGGQTEYYERVFVRAKLPVAYFQPLRSMAEPTTAKWQVMSDLCKSLLPLLKPAPDDQQLLGACCALSMMERFLGTAHEEMMGSLKGGVKEDRVPHPHQQKVQMLIGIFANLDVPAAMYLLVDVWEQSCAHLL